MKYIFNLISISFFLLTACQHLDGQNLKGQVLDKKTGEPIEAVNIFIANSTKGTFTDSKGDFELKGIQNTTNELIVSSIGYKTIFIKIENQQSITIELESTIQDLNEITVSAKKDKTWKRRFNKFKKALLGQTSNAKKVEIKNPKVLFFKAPNKNTLIAEANGLLELHNRATGYKVFLYLEDFRISGLKTSYSAKAFYEALTPKNKKEEKRWSKNRTKTYLGSFPHFINSLLNDNLQKYEFDVAFATASTDGFRSTKFAKAKELIEITQDNLILKIPNSLRITYKKEKVLQSGTAHTMSSLGGQLGQKAEQEMMTQGNGNNTAESIKNYQTSFLFAKKNNIELDKFGRIMRPDLLKEYGYWTSEGVADWLPNSYLPEGIEQPNLESSSDIATKEITSPLERNGFILKDLIISNHEILSGGIAPNGIPSIDTPKFLKATDAPYGDDYKVLGIVVDGVARAYPIHILDRHEIVNDKFGKKSIVITYCPLCGSGMAFDATINNQKRTFGVSGLLYNSDVLLYDRETESLWSQIMMQSIAGKSSGQKLDILPLQYTSWRVWKSLYPNTVVLSEETGIYDNYTKVQYADYRNSEALMFPVTEKSDQFSNKEWVIGVEINGKFKAYPFSKLKKSKSIIEDKFNGTNLKITYNKTTETAIIQNEAGDLLPSVTLYWFAWYAFHPNTEVW